MSPIRQKVLLWEIFKVAAGVCLIAAVFSGRINPHLAAAIIGSVGLLYGAYLVYRAFRQTEHSNVLRRLRGDSTKIPTTTAHRAMNVVLGLGMVLCGIALLSIALRR